MKIRGKSQYWNYLHTRVFDEYELFGKQPEHFNVGDLNNMVKYLREELYLANLEAQELREPGSTKPVSEDY